MRSADVRKDSVSALKLLTSLVSATGFLFSSDFLSGLSLLSGVFSSFNTLFSPETTSTTVLVAAELAAEDELAVGGGIVEVSATAGSGCCRQQTAAKLRDRNKFTAWSRTVFAVKAALCALP